MRPPCEHGSSGTDPSIVGVMWNGPVGHCGCCGGAFLYCDTGTYTTQRSHGRSWWPVNRCRKCGGGYQEWSYDHGAGSAVKSGDVMFTAHTLDAVTASAIGRKPDQG